MKIARLAHGPWLISLAIIGNRAHVLMGDAVTALKLYAEGGEVPLGPEVNINVESVLRGEGALRPTKPYDPPEVWGSGITYEVSRERYVEEDVAKIMGRAIYDLVYESERPEIFFKATPSRCVGHGEAVAIREDSQWTLPEPELGVVIDSRGKVLAYTITNDLTARDLEAQNPLYLPQAKIYLGSCSIGPFLVTPDEVGDPYALEVSLRILRGGEVVFEGRGSTSRMRRRIDEQVRFLLRNNPVPDGTLLMTGAAVVPPRGVALAHGDVVEITISKLGTLRNPVVKL